jgi:poly(rC)-binding protein 2/3/4
MERTHIELVVAIYVYVDPSLDSLNMIHYDHCLQNFMAEAAPQNRPPASNPPAPPVDPGYSSYPPPYGATYGSTPTGAGPAPHNGGGYGGGPYHSNYGY